MHNLYFFVFLLLLLVLLLLLLLFKTRSIVCVQINLSLHSPLLKDTQCELSRLTPLILYDISLDDLKRVSIGTYVD